MNRIRKRVLKKKEAIKNRNSPFRRRSKEKFSGSLLKLGTKDLNCSKCGRIVQVSGDTESVLCWRCTQAETGPTPSMMPKVNNENDPSPKRNRGRPRKQISSNIRIVNSKRSAAKKE